MFWGLCWLCCAHIVTNHACCYHSVLCNRCCSSTAAPALAAQPRSRCRTCRRPAGPQPLSRRLLLPQPLPLPLSQPPDAGTQRGRAWLGTTQGNKDDCSSASPNRVCLAVRNTTLCRPDLSTLAGSAGATPRLDELNGGLREAPRSPPRAAQLCRREVHRACV